MAMRRMLLASAALSGLAGVAAASYVSDVQQCEVPGGSNLDDASVKQTVWHMECYQLSVPVTCLPKKSIPRLTDAYCSAFFRCWPMQAEHALTGAVMPTAKQTSDAEIRALEFGDGDAVGGFRVVARGRSDVLFDAFDTFAFAWLGLDVDRETESLQFKFGVALTGAGYRGIPLQDYLLYQLAMPVGRFYARLLLKESVRLFVQEAAAA